MCGVCSGSGDEDAPGLGFACQFVFLYIFLYFCILFCIQILEQSSVLVCKRGIVDQSARGWFGFACHSGIAKDSFQQSRNKRKDKKGGP